MLINEIENSCPFVCSGVEYVDWQDEGGNEGSLVGQECT